jgi:hypothetical protein
MSTYPIYGYLFAGLLYPRFDAIGTMVRMPRKCYFWDLGVLRSVKDFLQYTQYHTSREWTGLIFGVLICAGVAAGCIRVMLVMGFSATPRSRGFWFLGFKNLGFWALILGFWQVSFSDPFVRGALATLQLK